MDRKMFWIQVGVVAGAVTVAAVFMTLISSC